MITQQQALEATGCAYACARAANLRGPIYEYLTQVRQYIEQGAGAAPGADVVMVPRKVLEACSESLGSFCSDHGWSQADMDNMDALDLFLVVQHPQQEQPK